MPAGQLSTNSFPRETKVGMSFQALSLRMGGDTQGLLCSGGLSDNGGATLSRGQPVSSQCRGDPTYTSIRDWQYIGPGVKRGTEVTGQGGHCPESTRLLFSLIHWLPCLGELSQAILLSGNSPRFCPINLQIYLHPELLHMLAGLCFAQVCSSTHTDPAQVYETTGSWAQAGKLLLWHTQGQALPSCPTGKTSHSKPTFHLTLLSQTLFIHHFLDSQYFCLRIFYLLILFT